MSERSLGSNRLIVTGANAAHFANLTMLLASWRTSESASPLAVCDYGLTADQIELLKTIPGLVYLPGPQPNYTEPWEGKARIARYLSNTSYPWDILIWIDADAMFLEPLPALQELIDGYDLIIDAHVQSVAEIMHECNRSVLDLRGSDAYFSAGFWIGRRGCLLETYARCVGLVKGKGNLWEGDAFVAAIYHERLKIRTVCGSVWHSRGKTSLHTCETVGLRAFHAGQPIHVLHANDGYVVRADGRRVFKRPDLAAIQDHFEEKFWREVVPANFVHVRNQR